jgi:hypothetical protein
VFAALVTITAAMRKMLAIRRACWNPEVSAYARGLCAARRWLVRDVEPAVKIARPSAGYRRAAGARVP